MWEAAIKSGHRLDLYAVLTTREELREFVAVLRALMPLMAGYQTEIMRDAFGSMGSQPKPTKE